MSLKLRVLIYRALTQLYAVLLTNFLGEFWNFLCIFWKRKTLEIRDKKVANSKYFKAVFPLNDHGHIVFCSVHFYRLNTNTLGSQWVELIIGEQYLLTRDRFSFIPKKNFSFFLCFSYSQFWGKNVAISFFTPSQNDTLFDEISHLSNSYFVRNKACFFFFTFKFLYSLMNAPQ